MLVERSEVHRTELDLNPGPATDALARRALRVALEARRLAPGRDERIQVAGWRHSAGSRLFDRSYPQVDDELQDELVRWFEEAFPCAGALAVETRWSGVFGWTADYLPLVAKKLCGAPAPAEASLFSPERFG